MKFLITLYQWLVGGTFFFVFLLLSFLLTFIFPLRMMDPFVKWMLRLNMRLLFIKVEVAGLEHLEKGKSYLFSINKKDYQAPTDM